MDKVVGSEQADAIVVPSLHFAHSVARGLRGIHVGEHHQVTAVVVLTADERIARTFLNGSHLGIAEDGVAVEQVVPVASVAA